MLPAMADSYNCCLTLREVLCLLFSWTNQFIIYIYYVIKSFLMHDYVSQLIIK